MQYRTRRLDGDNNLSGFLRFDPHSRSGKSQKYPHQRCVDGQRVAEEGVYGIGDHGGSAADQKGIARGAAECLDRQTAYECEKCAQSGNARADEQLEVFVVRLVEVPAAEEFL